jgi:succinate dehydrogenase/fumarate reductase iron-sulfur protein
MEVTLKILRFNPEVDTKPHYETFVIPDAQPNDQILDLLESVRGYQDGTLGFRRSCAHGICGSDAMRINGRNRLACKMLVQDVGSNEITIEPIMGLPVIKDLIVNMEPFWEHYRSVLPYFMCPDDPVRMGKSVFKVRKSASAMMTPPNAFFVLPAQPPVQSSGPMANTMVRQPWLTRTALYLIRAIVEQARD